MWHKIDDNVVEGVFYLTCIKKMGEITQVLLKQRVQKMKRAKNLWFTEQGDYVYYTPSHYKEM